MKMLASLACGIFLLSAVEAVAEDSGISIEAMSDDFAREEVQGLSPAESDSLYSEWDARRPGWRQRGYTVCYARNARGVTFRASGYGMPRRIQREAMQECRRRSFRAGTCYALGCNSR